MAAKFSIELLIFSLLTGIMLLSLGPITALLPNFYYNWWPGILLLLSMILLLWRMIFHNGYIGSLLQLSIYFIAAYGVMVLTVGGIHVVELFSINPYTIINTVGDIVQYAKGPALTYTCQYLLFPVFFIMQILLLREMKILHVALINAFCIIINLTFVYYQGLYDSRFLNNWHPEKSQVNGLFTDPNALSLSSYLLIIFFVSASFLVKARSFKKIFIVIIILLIGAMTFAGGRSMPGGLVILIITFPLIIALGYNHWPARKRILVGSLSMVLFVSSIVCMPFIIKNVENWGKAGERLASTYYKFEQNGVSSILVKDELRGESFSSGILLIKEAPLFGWGPWGYYREYPNQVYQDAGVIKSAPDIVLNHYLGLAVDLGLLLAFFNAFLMLLPIVLAGYCLKHGEDVSQRMGILVLIFGDCIFMLMINMMPASFFSEAIWLLTGQMAFLMLYAERTIRFSKISLTRFHLPLIFGACIGVGMSAIGAYKMSFGATGYEAKKDSYWWPLPPFDYNWGCYPPDKLADRSKGRWCGKESIVQIPIASSYEGKDVTFIIDNQYPDLQGNPVVLQYGGKAGVHSTVVLTKKGKISLTLPLDENHLYSYHLNDGEKRRFLVLSLKPSRTWSPRDFGVADNRQLGVLVSLSELKNN